jgi:hypothetical protein
MLDSWHTIKKVGTREKLNGYRESIRVVGALLFHQLYTENFAYLFFFFWGGGSVGLKRKL